tara:strand:+ start:1104 stop:1376 length:273 start_codon:yes stop_codon:yes gene_type:complete
LFNVDICLQLDECGGKIMLNTEAQPFPKCPQCDGVLVPLSDFGSQGASILYKAWVCTSVPNCNMNIKIRNGDVIINEPIMDGSGYAPRAR